MIGTSGKVTKHSPKYSAGVKIEQSTRPNSMKGDRKSMISFPTTPKRSEMLSPIFSIPAKSRLEKIDNFLSKAKVDIEEVYYSSQNIWSFKKDLSLVFEELKKNLSDECLANGPDPNCFFESFQLSSPKSILKKPKKPKSISNTENSRILGEYAEEIKNLKFDLELEKTKNSELSVKLSKIEVERDGLINTNNSIVNSFKIGRKESRDLDLSDISRNVSRRYSSLLFKLDQEEQSFILTNLMKENEELKKNLEVIIHSYDNMHAKISKQNLDFQSYRDSVEEGYFFKETQIKELFFDLYSKVFKDQESQVKLNSLFSANPGLLFSEVLSKFEKLKENFEVSQYLLEKLKEEQKNLTSKIAKDRELQVKLENDLKQKYEQQLAICKNDLSIQKEKKKNIKSKMSEKVNECQLKVLENQSLSEEFLNSQAKVAEFSEEVKSKNQEVVNLVKENELKSSQIQDLKNLLKEKESSLTELRLNLTKRNKLEIEKEKEYLASKHLIESLQTQLFSFKKLLEESESKNNESEFALKVKEAEQKGVESKLNLQISINERLKETFHSTKNEIIKKYKEKLDEKEKLLSDLQDQTESLSKKLELSKKHSLSLDKKLQNKEQELADKTQQETDTQKKMILALISRLSAKTGESFPETSQTVQDSIRTAESLVVILLNQLDSSSTQLKLAQNDLVKLREDLRNSQTLIQELSLKLSNSETLVKSTENCKFLLKEKCISRKNSLVSAENQLKEKDLLYLQNLQVLKERFKTKKQGLKEKLKNKDSEITELKKKTETLTAVQEREKLLTSNNEDLLNKLKSSVQEIEKFKIIREEDEKIKKNQTKIIQNLTKLKEAMIKAENELKAEKETILVESSEKIKGLQENVSFLQSKIQESPDEDEEEYGEKHVTRLFQLIQDKETALKKANKRLVELQWAHHDVIEECKVTEEKYLSQVEESEQKAMHIEKLELEAQSLNNRIEELERIREDLKDKNKYLKESELSLKKQEKNLLSKLEEAKTKCDQYEDEAVELQSEISEYKAILKNYSEETASISIAKKKQEELIRRLKEETEDITREKLFMANQILKYKQEIANKESLFETEKKNFDETKEKLEKIITELEFRVSENKQIENPLRLKFIPAECDSSRQDPKSSRNDTSDSIDRFEMIEKLHEQLEEKSQELQQLNLLYSDLQKDIKDLKSDFSIKELKFQEEALKNSQSLNTAKNAIKLLKKEKKRLEKSLVQPQVN